MVYVWLDKFLLTPPIFPSKDQKKTQLQSTPSRIIAHHLAVIATTQASLHPFSTIAIRQRLSKITDSTCHFQLTKFGEGAINLEGGVVENPPPSSISALGRQEIYLE